ncbi:hypothetical protein ACFL6G_07775 [candidate division KSB1 bacterium]
MPASTIRMIVIVLLIFHGIGHYMGILSIFGIKLSQNMSSHSWFLTDLTGDKAARIIAFMLWVSAFAGFICSGLGLGDWIIPNSAWQIMAVISAFISLTGVILFWNAFAFLFNRIGVLAVNIAVLLSVLWLHLPASLYND